MRRRAVERLPDHGGTMKLGQEHHRHLVRVLRMNVGDKLILFDRRGFESYAEIKDIRRDDLTVSLETPIRVDRELRCAITLAFALPKGRKPDLILQKGTELGVKKFMIFLSQRTVARPALQKIDSRLSRWQGIIDAACAQSGRTFTPDLTFHYDLLEMLPRINSDLRLCFSLDAETRLSQAARTLPKSVALLIGPEGGLTVNELAEASRFGFQMVTFGRRILRAETAAMAAVIPFALD